MKKYFAVADYVARKCVAAGVEFVPQIFHGVAIENDPEFVKTQALGLSVVALGVAAGALSVALAAKRTQASEEQVLSTPVPDTDSTFNAEDFVSGYFSIGAETTHALEELRKAREAGVYTGKEFRTKMREVTVASDKKYEALSQTIGASSAEVRALLTGPHMKSLSF